MIKEKKIKLSNPSTKAGGILSVVTSFCLEYWTLFAFFSIKADKKKSPAEFTKKVTSKIPMNRKFLYYNGVEHVAATGINP